MSLTLRTWPTSFWSFFLGPKVGDGLSCIVQPVSRSPPSWRTPVHLTNGINLTIIYNPKIFVFATMTGSVEMKGANEHDLDSSEHDTKEEQEVDEEYAHSMTESYHYGAEGEGLTPAEYRSLKFKSNMFFLFSGIAFGAQAMDKSVTAAGSVMGLRKDHPLGLAMKGKMFSYVNISYFIGYVVMNVPFSIFLLEKVGARYNGLILAISGMIVACSGASQNYAGYIATRTLLGVMQSVCEPTVAVTMHQWAHGGNHYGWALTWITWNGVGQLFLQALGYGLFLHGHPTKGHIYGPYSIAPWRIFFIIVGIMTFIYGLMFYLLVPNSPQNSNFLNEKEKSYMRHRSINRLNRPFRRIDVKPKQIIEAFTTGLHHSALLFFAVFVNALNGSAVNTYNNIWLKDFIRQAHPNMTSDESSEQSLLYGMISPAIKIVLSILISVASLKGIFRNYRCVYVLFFMVIHLIATCLLAYGPTPHARYGGLFLYNATVEVAHAGMFSVVASNMGGLSKKITVNGLLLIAQGVGGCIGPRIFSNVSKQSKARAGAMVALSAISLACLAGLFLSFFIENKIRDKKNEKLPKGVDRLELTDREDVEFRYHL